MTDEKSANWLLPIAQFLKDRWQDTKIALADTNIESTNDLITIKRPNYSLLGRSKHSMELILKVINQKTRNYNFEPKN